jgi:hypothetical protein
MFCVYLREGEVGNSSCLGNTGSGVLTGLPGKVTPFSKKKLNHLK